MSEKKQSVKRNPLMAKATPLSFDNVKAEELIQLTDEQKADRFTSRWMEIMHPFTTYARALGGPKESKRTLKEIKNFYTRFVLREEWEEKKYVLVVNSILDARAQMGLIAIERFGKRYDDEELPAQVRERRANKR